MVIGADESNTADGWTMAGSDPAFLVLDTQAWLKARDLHFAGAGYTVYYRSFGQLLGDRKFLLQTVEF